jgi:hypothetical protein
LAGESSVLKSRKGVQILRGGFQKMW